MQDFIKRENLILHIGSDYSLRITVDGFDLTGCAAVMKLRENPTSQAVLLEATCRCEGQDIICSILGKDSLKAFRRQGTAVYDVFVTANDRQIKLVRGNVTLIPDVSMH